MIRYLIERPQLSRFGPLSIVHVQERQPIFFIRYRGSDTTVHAAAYEDHCKFIFHYDSLPAMSLEFYCFPAACAGAVLTCAGGKSSLILASEVTPWRDRPSFIQCAP